MVIVAYDAESTIEAVLDRIPAGIAARLGGVYVSDDGSADDTAEVARAWGRRHRRVALTVTRQPINLGYGGNQRHCYEWAAAQGHDFVVMVHGDGQYAPELIEQMLAPLAAGRTDAVFGSRMLEPRDARRGGMPLYKWVGNRVLTAFQNRTTGLELSEWHTGFRAYTTAVLNDIDLATLARGFEFDTQIILELARRSARIAEIPIPTFYGDEKCHVNGLRYAYDVSRDVVRYRRQRVAG